jgi:ferric-dicitrate binding protein FerR (iron transport regulator)
MNDKDRIWYLVGKKLTNEADADELKELEDLLRSHPEMHYALQNITDLWNLPVHTDAEAEDAFDRHIAHMQASGVKWNNDSALPVTTRSRKNFLLPAVIMIIFIAAGIYIFYPSHKAVVAEKTLASTLREISTNNGSRTKISLPDGTQVSLNADSKITWENPFNGAIREVNLTGEAYFDVAHDEKRPFIVHTSGIDIKVLGTVFTVKSYPSDNTIETTLLKGSIEVLKRDDPDSSRVILRPSQKLVFNKQKQTEMIRASGADARPSPAKIIEKAILVTNIPSNKPDSMRKETSWVYNKLVFDGDRFDELAVKIERWYNVHIIFKNERAKQYRFVGEFTNESIAQAMDALKLTARFEYRIDGNKIEIDNR